MHVSCRFSHFYFPLLFASAPVLFVFIAFQLFVHNLRTRVHFTIFSMFFFVHSSFQLYLKSFFVYKCHLYMRWMWERSYLLFVLPGCCYSICIIFDVWNRICFGINSTNFVIFAHLLLVLLLKQHRRMAVSLVFSIYLFSLSCYAEKVKKASLIASNRQNQNEKICVSSLKNVRVYCM